VFATRGETFYGLVLRARGDRRFDVENVETGAIVHCRLKGSMKRSQFVRADDWVLVAMRDYESDTEHHERRGEIILKYTATQWRQLFKAGEIPDRNALRSHATKSSSVVFVDDWTPEDYSSTASVQHDDHVPRFDEESDEGPDEDEVDHHMDQDATRFLCEREDDLPSPTLVKKTRSRRSCQSDSAIQIDFHHTILFLPDSSHPVAQTTPSRINRSVNATKPAPPAPVTVTIRARVKFWDGAKGLGYATPEDKSQTKAGVDVKLTAECGAGLNRPLQRDDVVEVNIDPRHDRPYVLDGGLRVVGRA